MNLDFHIINNATIAELVSETALVNSVDDAVDLLGNASFQGAKGIIIREEHLSPAFFDLSTRIAGEILQKFSNYRMRLAIIGNFSKYSSQSLRDFIYESNKAGHIVFVPTIEEAMTVLSR
jgi:hypothetical protein